MSILNECFDHIYYINLDKRQDRNESCMSQFAKFNIVATRFAAVDGTCLPMRNGGAFGCLKSHLGVIVDAKSKGYNSILVLEDDVLFYDSIEKDFIRYYGQLNSDWDMLYLGGNHNVESTNNFDFTSQNIIKCTNTHTTHCYAVKSTIYDMLIGVLNNAKKPVDVEYASIQKNINCYAFYPSLSTQNIGFSDIERQYVDYTSLIK